MKVAILSDVHDNIWKLAQVLDEVRRAGAGALIYCGDLCAPFTLKQIGDEFEGPVHVVQGNNDGDMLLLARIAAGLDNVTLYGPFAVLDLAGRAVAVNHYPQIARDQARSGQYDLVCYGHDHTPHIERVGDTLLVNPGEVMGRFGKSTYALYDTLDGNATLQEV
ncbi:MAG: metallophosphoesterase [Anaerolineae bacterium]|nr:metallophosphoesterase [Anaerolineae bacterium]